MFRSKSKEIAATVRYIFDINMTPSKIYILVTLWLLTSLSIVQAQNKTFDSLKIIFQTIPDDTNRVNCLIKLCIEYSDVSLDKVLETAHEALACARRTNFEKGMCEAYGCLAGAYLDAGNNRKALEYYLEALRIAEKRNDLREAAFNYHDIGLLYINDRKFEEGIAYLQKAEKIWRQTGNARGLSMLAYNTGYAYGELGNDSLAMQYYQGAIKQGKGVNEYAVVASMNNISGIYLKRKQYAVSHAFIDSALALCEQYNLKTIMPEIYGRYSELYREQGMHDKALALAEKSLTLAQSMGIQLYIKQNYKHVADAHRAMGNYAKAYDILEAYTVMNDTINEERRRLSIEQTIHGYEIEKKDLELARQEQQYEAGIFRRNTFIALLVCLLLFGFLIYNRVKLILASKQQQLKYYTQVLLEKSTIIAGISEELDTFKNCSAPADEKMEKFGRILQLKIHTEEDWEKFKNAFEEVYPRFFGNLRYTYPDITASELRLAAITKLNLSLKEASTMLGISTESVKQSRYRLKKRIEVPEGSTLKTYLEQYN
jgi:tetratricopeptide (TPR) repeat protein